MLDKSSLPSGSLDSAPGPSSATTTPASSSLSPAPSAPGMDMAHLLAIVKEQVTLTIRSALTDLGAPDTPAGVGSSPVPSATPPAPPTIPTTLSGQSMFTHPCYSRINNTILSLHPSPTRGSYYYLVFSENLSTLNSFHVGPSVLIDGLDAHGHSSFSLLIPSCIVTQQFASPGHTPHVCPTSTNPPLSYRAAAHYHSPLVHAACHVDLLFCILLVSSPL